METVPFRPAVAHSTQHDGEYGRNADQHSEPDGQNGNNKTCNAQSGGAGLYSLGFDGYAAMRADHRPVVNFPSAISAIHVNILP